MITIWAAPVVGARAIDSVAPASPTAPAPSRLRYRRHILTFARPYRDRSGAKPCVSELDLQNLLQRPAMIMNGMAGVGRGGGWGGGQEADVAGAGGHRLPAGSSSGGAADRGVDRPGPLDGVAGAAP